MASNAAAWDRQGRDYVVATTFSRRHRCTTSPACWRPSMKIRSQQDDLCAPVLIFVLGWTHRTVFPV